MHKLAYVLVFLASVANAETSIRQDRPDTGTRINRELTGNTHVQANVPYEKLSDLDRQKVRAWYIDLGTDDEPPFPLGGLRDLLLPIAKGQQLLLVEGSLFVSATINPQGVVKDLQVFSSPSEDFTKGVANVFFNVRFKPAYCRGIPCEMEFPMRLKLSVN